MKKHVLLATHYAPILHGQAMIASQLLDVSKGWSDVKLHALNTAYNEKRSGFKAFSIGKVWKLIGFLRRSRRMIKQHDITEVIMCPGFFKGPFLKDAVFAWVLKKWCKVQIIGWIHMDPNRLDLLQQPKWFQKIGLKTLSYYSYFVAGAPALIEQWPSYLTQIAPVKSVSNGINDPILKEHVKDKNGKINVVYISAIDDEKGWRELVAAAEILCEDDDRYQFDFYGGLGAQLTIEEIEKVFFNLKQKDRIKWHGKVLEDEKYRVLMNASLFVLPSHTEQFSIAILEAMACGLAVVATDVGATKDAIAPNRLIAPKDVNSLSRMIAEVCEDELSMVKEGEANRAKFLAEFSEDIFSHKWNDLLRR